MTRMASEVLPDRIVRDQPNSSSKASKNRPIANSRPTIVNCVRQAPKTTGYRGSIEPIPSVPLYGHRNGRRRIPSRLCEQERLRERAHPASVGSGFLAATRRKHWSPTTLKRCQADFPTIREVTVSICWTPAAETMNGIGPRDKSRALCYQVPAGRRGGRRRPDRASGMKRARACNRREPGRLDPGSAGVSPAVGRRPTIVQAGGTPALPGTTRTMLGSIAGARAFRQLPRSIRR